MARYMLPSELTKRQNGKPSPERDMRDPRMTGGERMPRMDARADQMNLRQGASRNPNQSLPNTNFVSRSRIDGYAAANIDAYRSMPRTSPHRPQPLPPSRSQPSQASRPWDSSKKKHLKRPSQESFESKSSPPPSSRQDAYMSRGRTSPSPSRRPETRSNQPPTLNRSQSIPIHSLYRPPKQITDAEAVQRAAQAHADFFKNGPILMMDQIAKRTPQTIKTNLLAAQQPSVVDAWNLAHVNSSPYPSLAQVRSFSEPNIASMSITPSALPGKSRGIAVDPRMKAQLNMSTPPPVPALPRAKQDRLKMPEPDQLQASQYASTGRGEPSLPVRQMEPRQGQAQNYTRQDEPRQYQAQSVRPRTPEHPRQVKPTETRSPNGQTASPHPPKLQTTNLNIPLRSRGPAEPESPVKRLMVVNMDDDEGPSSSQHSSVPSPATAVSNPFKYDDMSVRGRSPDPRSGRSSPRRESSQGRARSASPASIYEEEGRTSMQQQLSMRQSRDDLYISDFGKALPAIPPSRESITSLYTHMDANRSSQSSNFPDRQSIASNGTTWQYDEIFQRSDPEAFSNQISMDDRQKVKAENEDRYRKRDIDSRMSVHKSLRPGGVLDFANEPMPESPANLAKFGFV